MRTPLPSDPQHQPPAVIEYGRPASPVTASRVFAGLVVVPAAAAGLLSIASAVVIVMASLEDGPTCDLAEGVFHAVGDAPWWVRLSVRCVSLGALMRRANSNHS